MKVISVGLFKKCSSLKYVNVPPHLTSIENKAFYLCQSLIRFSIPSTVTYLGKMAFRECYSLEEIHFEPGSSISCIESYSLMRCVKYIFSIFSRSHWWICKKIVFEYPSSLTTIKKRAFASCRKIVNVNVPSSVEHMADDAFYDCILLKKRKWDFFVSFFIEKNIFLIVLKEYFFEYQMTFQIKK